jgi:hypothetical protein
VAIRKLSSASQPAEAGQKASKSGEISVTNGMESCTCASSA